MTTKLFRLLPVLSGLLLGLGLASPSLAQPNITRADRLWIVDSHGKIVGTSNGNFSGRINTAVWLRVGTNFVQLTLNPSGFERAGGFYFESTDCQGTPWMIDWDAFSTSYAILGPSKTLYVPDPAAPSRPMQLKSARWANGECIWVSENTTARPPIPALDLETAFTAPFRMTLPPTDVQHIIDVPVQGATVGASFVVSGWALDPGASSGTGIDTIHIWAIRVDGLAPPQFLGIPQVVLRPDVAAIYGPQFGPSGYSLTTPPLSPGLFDVVVFPHRTSTGSFEGARPVRVTVQ